MQIRFNSKPPKHTCSPAQQTCSINPGPRRKHHRKSINHITPAGAWNHNNPPQTHYYIFKFAFEILWNTKCPATSCLSKTLLVCFLKCTKGCYVEIELLFKHTLQRCLGVQSILSVCPGDTAGQTRGI